MKSRVVLFALLPIALFLLPAGVFWIDRSIAEGEIPRNVSIAGIDVSGLSYDDAMLTIQAHEHQLQTTPAVFSVNDRSFQLDPVSVGVEIDEESAVTAAMNQRTEGGAFRRFFAWVGGFNGTVDIPVRVALDREAINDQLETWQNEAIPNPAYEGSVSVVDGRVAVEYPRAGERIEMEPASNVVVETLSSLDDREAPIPTTDHQPVLTNSDVDAAAAQVRRIIASDVTLSNDDIDLVVTFAKDEIARAVYTEVNTDPVAIEILLDEAVIRDLLEPRQNEIELPPRSAKFEATVSSGNVSIIPSRFGTLMDVPGVAAELLKAASGSGSGPFPIAQGDEPRLTTEEAEAYGPLSRVSHFTTNTPGRNRVHNIHLMADAVDETVVFPGETFSVNEVVGQRTEAKGYLEDCAIINGEVVCEGHPANIGGGVSQFATTLYNAIFYGCYEDVEHKPHSLYFSKYPEVVEATMGFPSPDVKFRNNTDAPVIIRTTYSSSQITVHFYGNNGGKKCTAEWGGRTHPEDYETVYVSHDEAELSLGPGQQKRIQSGKNGFTASVTRVITHSDGSVERGRTWTWRYRTQSEKIAVHRCMVTGKPVGCPSTTTSTTVPPASSTTSTTAPPPTSTTAPPATTSTTAPPATTSTTAPPATTSTTAPPADGG